MQLMVFLHAGLSDSEVNEKIAQAYRIPSHFELEDFTYENDALLEIIFRHLSNTSFRGFTVSW